MLVALHIYLIRTHGVTELYFKNEDRSKHKTFPFWPDHVMTELVMVSIIMFLLLILSLLFPVYMGEPANPNITPLHIKPEWYFYPVFRWLKFTNLSIGVIGPILFLILLFFWPYIDRFFEKLFPKKEIAMWIGVIGALLITIFLVREAIAH